MTLPIDSTTMVFVAIGPFLCCWLIVKWVLEVSRFLNGLRDSILSGRIDGTAIGRDHRWVLTWDWMISLTGTCLSLAAFYALFRLGVDAVESAEVRSLPLAGALGLALSSLAMISLVAAGGVLLCALMDLRGIWRAVKFAS